MSGRRPLRLGVVGGRRAVAEALAAGAVSEVLLARGVRDTEGLRALLDAAATSGVIVRRVDRRELDAEMPEHQGIVARLAAQELPSALSERELATHPFDDDALVVVLDGITDPQNLGACARNAEVAGASMLVTRIRRAADATPAAVRASAGALLHLPHARVANITKALQRLKDAGFFVIGLDAGATTSVYEEPRPAGRLALVVGSEGDGLSRLVRERCDALVRLPMAGRIGSLNASASLAAALWAFVVPSRRAAR